MSGWAGFSEEELRRLQHKDSAGPRGRRPTPANRSRQQLQRERALQLGAQRGAGAGPPGLLPEQLLTKPPPKEEPRPAAMVGPQAGPQAGTPPGPHVGPHVGPPAGPPAVRLEVQPQLGEGKAGENHQAATEEQSLSIKELEKQEVELREKTRLEQLQQEQRIIEERNKRKKALLAKTIAEKSKQTQAEAVKLKRIQKELQALDDMVSNDIGILRGRIEQASWDYTAARKRYEKAEAEYVVAKMDLHRKTEVKEQLTEHLCAIIQQNELRKAHKLEELMQQLQLQATEEEEEDEEEAKKRRSCVGDGSEANGSVHNQEAAGQTTKDCHPPEEEGEKEEVEEKPKTEADSDPPETRMEENKAVAS